jgi:glycosyltransferase involved in cell wall biosynthesis
MATVALDAREGYVPMPHGSGIYARRLAEALRARPDGMGPEVWVIERGGRGPELLWEQVTLPRLLRRRRPELVHHTNCFLPLRRPCPGVVTIHDLAFHDWRHDFSRRTGWKYRTFTPRSARSAERVVVPSTLTRDDVVARYGIADEKVRVIPLAPALAVSSEAPPPGPYLLAVGDLRPKKNLERLVEAFALLRRDGYPHRLVLAGADLGHGPQLRELAGDAPVELTGFVSDAQVDALLRGADAFIHPGLYEGFGMVVLEAMARGVPVALADATALPETGGDAALRFDPHDASDIAAHVRALLDDEAQRERLVAAGRARAAARTWDDVAADHVAVYNEIIEGGTG